MELIRARSRLASDRSGMAAVEFALLAPTLILIFVGVFEMTLRFRAVEETVRYVHQVADLVARESDLSSTDLDTIYAAATQMMRPLDTTERLDIDIAAIGFEDEDDDDVPEPFLLWGRYAGAQIPADLADAEDLGAIGESVIRVAVRYEYESPLTTIFGGASTFIEREAYARPREVRLLTFDGEIDHDGAIEEFGG